MTAILIVVLSWTGFTATFSDVGACIAVRDDLRSKYRANTNYIECWAAGSAVPVKENAK